MLKKIVLTYTLIISICLSSDPFKLIPSKSTIKNIVWDIGSTLTRVSRWNIAQEMGTKTVIAMLLHIGKPSTIQKKLFEVLESYAGKQKTPNNEDLLSCDNNNLPLPHFMSDIWLCSRISNKKLMKHINKAVDQWKPSRPTSKTERRIIKKVLYTALSAKILGKHTCCTTEALELVKECDNSGYHQYILSNFEKEAFELFSSNEKNRELFSYIPRENIVISGDCGMIKPYKCIYEYFLEKYNLNPEECLLIDDRPENIKAARLYGMYAIRLKNENYKKLTRTLKKWQIL